MIKANELRIGNWVRCTLSDKVIVIQGISKSDTQYGDYYIEYNNGSITVFEDFDKEYYVEGIPLTLEILFKTGLTYNTESGNYEVDFDFVIHNPAEGIFMFLSCHKDLRLKFLHQLQNLYFALNGEELTI